MRETAAFLRRHPAEDVALILVDNDGASRHAMLEARASEPGLLAEGRFRLAPPHTSLTTLRSSEGDPPDGAAFLANAANVKLSPKGGAVNRLIHDAAGRDELAALTSERHPPNGQPGRAYLVELPPGNALRAAESVTTIIHVVGPNMNAAKPNCLNGDYVQGAEQLAATYCALFETFLTNASLSVSKDPMDDPAGARAGGGHCTPHDAGDEDDLMDELE